ncbi:uncharacterized protein LOC131892001 isoform X2 [Tigriopus californicus]|uniref:uncharacterized protein LOC131892001 isoform X2 n=1 Tax=Tigriopus californicus TaxID=6832 RepID=UPI0027D9E822|nr:uncharacterized protein LOC131892001 isoform X2 [Tigriopus californicus]
MKQASVPRIRLWDRQNPANTMRDVDFARDHGLSKFAFCRILDLIQGQLDSKQETKITVPASQKLSAFLRFLRSGSLHRCVAGNKDIQLSQSMTCRIINKVANVIAEMQSKYVKFPDQSEQYEIANALSAECGFPPVVCGIVDGTHIEIQKPISKNPAPERFFNRKGYYSLNMMCVVDHVGKIRHFTCRHAGSAHDAKIFGESSLRAQLLADFDTERPLALLGDEGYGAEDVMLPPVRVQQMASAPPAMRQKILAYNKIHKKTRIKVEHAFGVLKKRFPVLLYIIRSTKLANIQAIVSSAIVIHNLLIDLKEHNLSTLQSERDYHEELSSFDLDQQLSSHVGEKFRLRNTIINTFF